MHMTQFLPQIGWVYSEIGTEEERKLRFDSAS